MIALKLTIVELNHLQRFNLALSNLGNLVHNNWPAGHERWFELLQYGSLVWLVDLGRFAETLQIGGKAILTADAIGTGADFLDSII